MKKEQSSKPLISIIIPVYNTAPYLRRCINSVINQTYKNLEIICIDDGSTDGSELIVDEYAKCDSRVKVVHKQNGGESSARNLGLKMMTGLYVGFLDCDDWIDEEMYETLEQALESESLDMVAASWYKETDLCSQVIRNELPVSNNAFSGQELLRYLYMRDSYRGFAYIWDKLYKKEILFNQYNQLILFDESLQLGGDVLYLAEVVLNIKKAKYIDKAYYHYNQRSESGCHTKDISKLRDWLKAYEIVLEKFNKEHIDENIINYVKRFLVYHSSNAVEVAVSLGEEVAKREFQRLMLLYEHEYVFLNKQYPERIQRYYGLLAR